MGLRTFPIAALGITIVAATIGCSSSRSGATTLILGVGGPATRTSRPPCVFVIRAAVRSGGTQQTCLTSIDGFPSPDATMHSRGTMTFALAHGTLALRVRITQRFAADAEHARQTVTGVVIRGRGAFAGAHGSLSGGGTVIDTRVALRIARLTYRLRIVR
jgi:hypothetical protein